MESKADPAMRSIFRVFVAPILATTPLVAPLLGEVVGFRFFATEDSHNVFHRNDIELIVRFKIDRDCIFGMEQDFVILPERNRFILFYLMTYRDNPTGDGWDFCRVWKRDPTFGFPFWFVFTNQNPGSDGLDVVKLWGFLCHQQSIRQPNKSASTFALALRGEFVILLGFLTNQMGIRVPAKPRI